MYDRRARDAAYYQNNRDRILARQAEYDATHQEERKRYKAARQTARLAEQRAQMVALKLTLTCVGCGWKPTTGDEVARLEFDHIDPATKWRKGAKAFNRHWSWARILREIALCEPRCKACHMARTWQQRHADARAA